MTLSIIGFIVYGLICYSTFIVLIISTIHPPKTEKIVMYRSMFFIPGIVCAVLIGAHGYEIEFPATTETVEDPGPPPTTISSSTSSQVLLIESFWSYVHYMLFIIMLVYVIMQYLTLLSIV